MCRYIRKIISYENNLKLLRYQQDKNWRKTSVLCRNSRKSFNTSRMDPHFLTWLVQKLIEHLPLQDEMKMSKTCDRRLSSVCWNRS